MKCLVQVGDRDPRFEQLPVGGAALIEIRCFVDADFRKVWGSKTETNGK